jgi:hypothetical protein
MLLLTPVKSLVLHAKMLLFLFRNESNSVSSSGDKSWEIITTLSGALRSRGTHLVSHSSSMTGLVTMLASLLAVPVCWWPSTSCSCKQFTFL